MEKKEVTLAEISDLLQLTKRRVQQLVEADVLAKTGRGKYLLKESVQGYINYLVGLERQKPKDLTAEVTRLRAAQADLAEKKLAEENGDLLPRDGVLTVMYAVMDTIQRELLNWPAKLSTKLARRSAEEVRAILKAEVATGLRRMSKMEPKFSKSEVDHAI